MREGDYLNLGAGAEIGIYSRPDWLTQNSDGLDHYFANTDFTLPMDVYLYNNCGGLYEQILAWMPTEEQWWITGFNPDHIGKVDANMEVLIGCVDFSGFEELYKAINSTKDSFDYVEKKKYLIFDEDNYCLWICWFV